MSELEEGRSFGELAILIDKKRAARVKAEELTYCAVLLKSDYIKALNTIENKKKDHIIEFIHEMPLFKKFSKTNLRRLTGKIQTLKFIRGQVVVN